MHVFDRYHSLWFPLWCLWGLIWAVLVCVSVPVGGLRDPVRWTVLPATLVLMAAGTWMTPGRGRFQLILTGTGATGFLLTVWSGLTPDPNSGLIIAATGALILLAAPRRPDEAPETGEPADEWIAGSLLAFILIRPPVGFTIPVILLMRFAAGMLFRIVPVRVPPDPVRKAVGRFSWLPVWVAVIAGSADPDGVLLPAAGWTAAILRAAVHLDDGLRRISILGRLVPAGSRLGLMRSYLIYYRIPFRRLKMMHFYGSFLKPGGRAWDVGAHLGNRSRIWLDLGLQVTAFEPQPACAALLHNWFGRCGRFTLVPRAVGSESGTTRLRISSRFPTLASVADDWVDRMKNHPLFNGISWETEIEVPQTTLAAVQGTRGPPDFVKVDVEGHEPAVLQGMGDPPAALSFEYLPADRTGAMRCLDLLDERARWRWNAVVKERFRYVFPLAVDRSELQRWLIALDGNEPSGDIYGWRIDGV